MCMSDQAAVRAQVLEGAARVAPMVAEALAEVLEGLDVVAGITAIDGEIARSMVLCGGGFVMMEISRSGDHLVVCLPLFRIKRVTEMRVGGVTRISVELDADRVVTTPQADTSSVTTPAAYDVAQPAGIDAEVRRFAAALRTVLAAG